MFEMILVVHNGIVSWQLNRKARKEFAEEQEADEQLEGENLLGKPTTPEKKLLRGDFAALERERKRRRNRREFFWRFLGRSLATMISSASALMAYASCLTVSAIASVWGLPLIVAIATFWMNLIFYWGDVQGTFIQLFVDGISKGLTRWQSILTKCGLVVACSGGLAVAALFTCEAWGLVMAEAAVTLHFFLGTSAGVTSAAFIAGLSIISLLAVAQFVCITAMMYVALARAIRHWRAIKDFLVRFVKRDVNKSVAQHVVEVIFKGFFLLLSVVLALLASILTLGSWNFNFHHLLMRIPKASEIAVRWAGYIIIYALTALGRIPLVLAKMCDVFVTAGVFLGKWVYLIFAGGEKRAKEWATLKKDAAVFFGNSPLQVIATIFKAIVAAIALGFNCIGNAMINIQGKGMAQDIFHVNPDQAEIMTAGLVGVQCACLTIPALSEKVAVEQSAKAELASLELENISAPGEAKPSMGGVGDRAATEHARSIQNTLKQSKDFSLFHGFTRRSEGRGRLRYTQLEEGSDADPSPERNLQPLTH